MSIGLVGEKTPFSVLEEQETAVYLTSIEHEERRGGGGGGSGSSGSKSSTSQAAGEGPQDPEVAVAMETD